MALVHRPRVRCRRLGGVDRLALGAPGGKSKRWSVPRQAAAMTGVWWVWWVWWHWWEWLGVLGVLPSKETGMDRVELSRRR